MAKSCVSMKTAIVLAALLALINPVFSKLQNPNNVPKNGIEDDLFESFELCPKQLKEHMAERVIDHMEVRHDVKDILRWSAKFVDCVAARFCDCVHLEFPPLTYGCFAAVGGSCMVKAFEGVNAHCALRCFQHIHHPPHPHGHKRRSDICFSKCLKKN